MSAACRRWPSACRFARSSITVRPSSRATRPTALYQNYLPVRAKGTYLLARPGNTIPVTGLDVRIVSANGDLITTPLPGAGQPNASCRDYTPKDPDPTENARSVGMVITFGRFRMLDLGDLTWNKEHDLVCPNNLLGTVDLYLTTHHGLDQSGSPQLVHAVHPRVAVMNNGARKGGIRERLEHRQALAGPRGSVAAALRRRRWGGPQRGGGVHRQR